MSRSFFATCALGLEEVLAAELEHLDALNIQPQRGRVAFHGTLATGYAACLWLRSASRVQEQLFRNRRADSRRALYEAVRDFDWGPILGPDDTLAISGTVRDSRANDSRFVGLVVKDAIVDQLRDRTGRRPNVDTDDPDVPLRVLLRQDHATVLRDLSGDSLHRRGWRPVQVKSPLNEAIAAGLLMVAGWNGKQVLHDPMCGSGTFLIEAAHMAQDRAPGLERHFAFERWADLNESAWRTLREDAQDRHEAGRSLPLAISGADHHAGALSIARRSVEAAGVDETIRIRRKALNDNQPSISPQLVVSNPPWGLRMGHGELEQIWSDLGRFLKSQCANEEAWLLSGDAALTQPLRLKAHRRHAIRIGPVDARWIHYKILPLREKPEFPQITG